MKKRYAIVILVAIAIAGFVAWMMMADDDTSSQQTTATAQSADGPILSGRIIDASGRPLVGANIFAGAAYSRADAQGRFEFAELPAEEVPIDATADGYLRPGVDALGRPVVDLRSGAPVDDLELILPRAASLSGRVVAGGVPVEDAEISLSYVFAEGLDGSELKPFIVSDVARTDADGEFSLDELAPGRLQIFVDTDDHDFVESDEIYFRAGQHRDGLHIDVAPAGRLRGTTIDANGTALPADITVIPWEHHLSSRTKATDDEGQFTFSHLDEGVYTIRAESPNHRTEELSDVVVEANRVVEVELVLQPTRGIIGRVVEPDGSPVSNARIGLRSGDDDHQLRSDSQGRFHWEDAPPGQWVAIASSPGHAASSPKRLTHDEEASLVVTPGGTISGRVVGPRGRPVRNYEIAVASMQLDAPDGPRYQPRHMASQSVSNMRGQFELGPLQSGLFRLIVTTDDYAPATTDGIRVAPGSDSGGVVIELEHQSSLGGIVRNAQTGEPVANAQLYFLMRSPGNRSPNTRTDADGHYFIDHLPSARSSIRVVHNQYIHELFSGIELPSGGHMEYDIDLEPIGDGEPGLAFQGIGAALGPSEGGFEIVHINDDTPAAAAGIRPGDLITGVEGRPVDDMTLDQVVEFIRGEPGQPVSLDVHRSGRGTRTIEVDRDRFVHPQQRQVRPTR